MKKVLALLLVLGLASIAGATVIDVVAVDVGLSEGRLGSSEEDKLLASDVIGIKLVLNHNPYPGSAYPSYDGYLLSSMDLDLHVVGAASMDAGTWDKTHTNPIWQYNSGLSPFVVNDNNPWSEIGNGLDQITAVSLAGVSANLGAVDLMWDLLVHCEGDGNVLIDLTLNGLSEYAEYQTPGGGPYPEWIAMVEEDLGDLTIYQVPEPITLALLGLGGLFLRRRK